MTDDRPITPEQALLAVKAAGLDPNKSLNEQLGGDENGALERRVADLSERVNTLTETLGAAGQPTDPPTPHERQQEFAENFRDALNQSRTPWYSTGGDDAA